MKIVYVAKHGSGGNEDEDAISHALRELGHEVICIDQRYGYQSAHIRANFVLFHKWYDLDVLKAIKYPKVFWYFDLVRQNDPRKFTRTSERVKWMADTIPLVDLAFCTDGDFVISMSLKTDKICWLPQGADNRKVGMGNGGLSIPYEKRRKILFTGTELGGTYRESFVHEMRSLYGLSFDHVKKGLHGRRLADRIADSAIVVAPDSPSSDYYWSNRVYLSLGFGAFMLHPYCAELTQHYIPNKEIVYYKDRTELHLLIEYYLSQPQLRQEIANAGLTRTIRDHTYTN